MKTKNILQAFVLMTMLFGLTSCSTKIAYNNLDWIVSWYVDDYVTLTDSQENEFDETLDAFLLWHRNTELKNYIVQIKSIQTHLNEGIDRSNIEEYVTSIKSFLQVSLIKAEPDVINFAYSLSDKQAGSFLAEFERQNLNKIEKFEEKSNEKRLEDRLEKLEEQISSFVGKLNEQQLILLKNGNTQLLSSFEERIKFRRNWANSIREAYVLRAQSLGESEKNKTLFELALKQSILQAESLRSDKYVNILEHNQTVRIDTLDKILNSLNKKQLAHLNSKLNETIKDLEALL